jgi:phage protein U
MAILATLGDIPFQVLKNGFRSFKLNSRLGWAIHPRLLDKPTIQNVGDDLDFIYLDFVFHRKLIDPEEAVKTLKKSAQAKKPLPLVFGEIYKGQWVIEDLEENPVNVTVRDSGDSGSGESATVIDVMNFSMSLLEFSGGKLRGRATQASINPFRFSS